MDAPRSIKKLDESVINRIAAGEVIQRPANALKEMIENSIDAKANSILIVVKDGGLKFLQICDNGTGIRREDFEIVCERFTTSKLQTFEDLNSINTYGFRGEALASISHVAHLTIQSKTVNSDCAYKGSYADSKLKGPPKPCAGNQGTIITVEDLFYNMTTRRNALKNATDEFNKISDVVSKYAIHNASAGFALKKFGQTNSIKTPSNSNHIDNIRAIYGNGIARELIKIDLKNDELKFELHGFITNVNYSAKKGIFLLFINNRLVDSSAIKRSIDAIYATYLPKNMHPFIYISLEIDPTNADVNVHPTKQEVHFLHEEQIIEKIIAGLEAKLLGSNNSKVFYTQTKLPSATEKLIINKKPEETSPVVYDKNLIRTNSNDQKLDKFICKVQNTSQNTNMTILNMSSNTSQVNKIEVKLTSILQFRENIENNCHQTMKELFSEHVFVGCVTPTKTLIQHSTKLYLCNMEQIMEEFFYQLVMYNFQNFGTITFDEPLCLNDLAMLALNHPDTGWTEEDGSKTELAERVVEIFLQKKLMLKEYFSFEIDDNNNLIKIPLLLDGHVPEMAGLPIYVLRLATEVKWNKERTCFYNFARETATYYSKIVNTEEPENPNWKWIIEHIYFPAMKKSFYPPKNFIDNASILQIADLPNLYKVFERC